MPSKDQRNSESRFQKINISRLMQQSFNERPSLQIFGQQSSIPFRQTSSPQNSEELSLRDGVWQGKNFSKSNPSFSLLAKTKCKIQELLKENDQIRSLTVNSTDIKLPSCLRIRINNLWLKSGLLKPEQVFSQTGEFFQGERLKIDLCQILEAKQEASQPKKFTLKIENCEGELELPCVIFGAISLRSEPSILRQKFIDCAKASLVFRKWPEGFLPSAQTPKADSEIFAEESQFKNHNKYLIVFVASEVKEALFSFRTALDGLYKTPGFYRCVDALSKSFEIRYDRSFSEAENERVLKSNCGNLALFVMAPVKTERAKISENAVEEKLASFKGELNRIEEKFDAKIENCQNEIAGLNDKFSKLEGKFDDLKIVFLTLSHQISEIPFKIRAENFCRFDQPQGIIPRSSDDLPRLFAPKEKTEEKRHSIVRIRLKDLKEGCNYHQLAEKLLKKDK